MFRELLIRYRRKLLLAMALLLPLASLYHHGKPRKQTSLLEKALMTVTSPAQAVTRDALDSMTAVIDAYFLLLGVKERNKSLETENKLLLGEALKSRALGEELSRVKRLCQFRRQREDLTTIPARVVGREISQFFRVLRVQLDVQGIDHLKEGLAVITHDGVVGRIEKFSGRYANVMLVTDARSRVHATVAGKGLVGTVRGKGKRKQFGVEFIYLDHAERIDPLRSGDAVLTTGHDRVFPTGIEIGHITSDPSTRKGPYHEFTLTPAVTFATLEEVLIVAEYRTPTRKTVRPKASQSRRLRLDPANQPDG